MSRGQVVELTEAQATESYQDYYSLIDGSRTTYINSCNKFEQFTFGNQYTKDEIDDMVERGQYPAKINRSLKYITTLTGMLTANNAEFKAYPFGREDAVLSDICNMILHFINKRSGGTLVKHKAVFTGLAANMGFITVGQNDRNYTSIFFSPVQDVVVSRDAKDSLFRDASVIYTHKWMTVKQAAALYGIPEHDINTDAPEGIDFYYSGANDERTIVESNLYDETKTMIKVIEGEHRIPMKEFVKDDKGEDVWTGNVKIQMVKKTLIGYRHAFVEELPETITEHSQIPIFAYDTNNIFKLGLMSRLYDYQRLLNKSFSIMLLNAQLASNPKVFVYEGQIPNDDIDAFADTYAQAGSINLLAGQGGKDAQPPLIVGGQPLSNAWYTFVTMMMQEMEFSALPNQMLGIDSQANQPKGHLFEQYQMTIDSIRTFLNIYDAALAQVGKVILQYFSTYNMDERTLERIFNLKGREKEIQDAQSKNLTEDPRSHEAFVKQAVENGMPRSMAEYEVTKFKGNLDFIAKVKGLKDNHDFIDFDIEVVKGSYLPSASMLKFYQKLELFREGIVDNVSMLEDAPLENRDETIARVSTINQVVSENERLTMENEKAKSEIAALNKAIVDAGIKLEIEKSKFGMDKQKNDFVQKERKNQAIANMTTRMKQMEAQSEQKEQWDGLMLKIKEAVQDYKLANKHGVGTDELPDTIEIGDLLNQIAESENANR